MTEPLHFITVKHERDEHGEIDRSSLTFECRGDESSPCHNYPDCDCDGWDVEVEGGKHVHPNVPQPVCWIATWFDAGDVDVNPYNGDGSRDPAEYLWMVPEHSGPIEYEYEECIHWHWTDLDDAEAWPRDEREAS